MKLRIVVFFFLASWIAGCDQSKSKKPDVSPVIMKPEPIVNPDPIDGCGDEIRHPLWAQTVVDADLMQAYSLSQGAAIANEKIAVIDSGFDRSLEKNFPGPVLGFQATSSAFDPDSDISRHGSFIAGLIGSSEFGIAPGVQLGSFKMPDKDGYYTYSDVYEGALKACREGYKLINVSQGSSQYESRTVDEAEDFKSTLDELHESGCLILKSAGNASYLGKEMYDHLDDSLLLVEAASVSRSMSVFSSEGEVRAPGSLIGSLNVTDDKTSTCRTQHRSLSVASGTSFAAPIAAGILAHVRAHLARSSDFINLSSAKQLSLLNHIAKASEQNGIMNGYRAVMIASHWSADRRQVDELKAILDPLCSVEEVKNCSAQNSIDAFLSCQAPLRRQLALCPQTLDVAVKSQFLKDLVRFKATDLWLNYAGLIGSPETLPASARTARSMIAPAIVEAMPFSRNYSWLEGLDILELGHALIKGGVMDKSTLSSLFASSSMLDILGYLPGRDGHFPERLLDFLRAVQAHDKDFLLPAFSGAYERTVQGWKDRSWKVLITDSMARIRLFNIVESVVDESAKGKILELEQRFVKLLRYEWDESPSEIGDERNSYRAFAWHGPTLFDFYQAKGLNVDDIFRDHLWSSVPASFVLSALDQERRQNKLEAQYPRIAMAVIHEIGASPKWAGSGSSDFVLQAAFENIAQVWDKLPAQQANLGAELTTIMDATVNNAFKVSMLNPWVAHLIWEDKQQADGSWVGQYRSRFISYETRQKYLLQILAEFPMQSAEVMAGYTSFVGDTFRDSMDLLPQKKWQNISLPAAWQTVSWYKIDATRLDKTIPSTIEVNGLALGSTADVLGKSTLAFLDSVTHEVRTLSGYRLGVSVSFLKEYQGLDNFCSAVNREKLKVSVSALIQAIDTAEMGKYYQYLKPDLQAFDAQCLH